MPSARDLLRHKPKLRQIEDAALNAETPTEFLDAPLTADENFFVRNNGDLPDLGADAVKAWRLTIDGDVERSLSLSLAELKARFETVHVTAVLEGAGNGRSGFTPATDGLQWGLGAVGCARWSGVRVRDLLAAAGPRPSAVYIGHESPDRAIGKPHHAALSRGLPIAKAMAEETLVAFAMNGAPLPLLHGFPLRIVAPGYPGSAWQKWLTRIWVRDREHDGAKMTGTDYRMPRRPYAPGEPVDPRDFDVMTDMPLRSMITTPANGFRCRVGEDVAVGGFAWAGHTPVASVELSVDGGATWQPAVLEPEVERFAWRRFSGTCRAGATGAFEVAARARDIEGRVQPLGMAPWNPRGYWNNAVHRVRGTIDPT